MRGRPSRVRRGIYVVPTVFTVGNLFCGYASIVHTSLGHLELAAALIVVAAVLDGLDGRIARLTGTTSEFGIEFDSLADLVSFGVAPALLAYHWGLAPAGRSGWTLAFLYVVAAAMRLARFNLRRAAGDKRFFAGLPSPMAASSLASIVYAFPAPASSLPPAVTLAVLMFAVAALMLSRVRYRSFREFDLRNRRSYLYVLPLAAVVVAVVLQPKAVLLALSTGYVVSGPIVYLAGLRHGRRRATDVAAEPDATEVADEPTVR